MRVEHLQDQGFISSELYFRDYRKKFDSRYRKINGKCFYFGKKFDDYEPHDKFCKELFSGNGRLYEPTDVRIFQKIQKMAFKYGETTRGMIQKWQIKIYHNRNYPDKIRHSSAAVLNRILLLTKKQMNAKFFKNISRILTEKYFFFQFFYLIYLICL